MEIFEEPIEVKDADLPPLQQDGHFVDTNASSARQTPPSANAQEPTAAPQASAVAESGQPLPGPGAEIELQAAREEERSNALAPEQPSLPAAGNPSRPVSSTGERAKLMGSKPKSEAVHPVSTDEVGAVNLF